MKKKIDVRITPFKHVSERKNDDDDNVPINRNCSDTMSNEMLSFLSNFFYRMGHVVSMNPLTTIFITLTVVLFSSVGVLWIHIEKLNYNLWLPKDSDLYKNKQWMDRFFPQNTSSESPVPNGFLQSVIISGENVLKPDVIAKMFVLHQRIVNHLDDYRNHCIVAEEFDACANFSILRLWDFDEAVLTNLTEEAVNETLRELPTRVDRKYHLMMLCDVWETPDGSSIAGAKAVLLTWNMVAHTYADWYTSFESNFYKVVEEMQTEFESLVYCGGRGFDTESTVIFQRELKYVIYGYALVFLFMVSQMRYDGHLITGLLVSLAGLSAVGFSVVLMAGFCSLLGPLWSNIHLIVPAILLGIGIDDMFVVIQTLKIEKAGEVMNPSPLLSFRLPGEKNDDRGADYEEGKHIRQLVTTLLSKSLGQVGLAIFVTSLSDVLAFVVGSTFIMPATSSLCIWLGVGISFVFLLMSTYFIACLALIERYRLPKWRREIAHQEEEWLDSLSPNKLFSAATTSNCCLCKPKSRRERARNIDRFSHNFKKYYVPLVCTPQFRVLSSVSTLGLLLICAHGITQVELGWDVWKLIAEDSFLHHFKEVAQRYFPALTRIPLQLIFRDIEFHESTGVITEVVSVLDSFDPLTSRHNWLKGFEMYLRLLTPSLEDSSLRDSFPLNNVTHAPVTRDSFHFWLNQFLNSSVMDSARKDLYFDENVTYTFRNGTEFEFVYHPLKACQFTFGHELSKKVSENSRFLQGLNKLVLEDFEVPKSNAFLFSQLFITIELEKFLPGDLTRNICLSLLLIGVVILVFFANFRMSLLCSLTVFLSLLDVFGLIHYYGLTLSPVTAMTMTILIGLGIDFSVHIGHSFIYADNDINDDNDDDVKNVVDATSSRETRIRAALSKTGPAIIHGGLSTAIAMAPLIPSDAYTFQAFSKLIVSMVAVGLWHGLVFLPTLLYWFGPLPSGVLNESSLSKAAVRLKTVVGGSKVARENVTAASSASVGEADYSRGFQGRTEKKTIRKKKRRSLMCGCVDTKKEVRTVRTTYSTRADRKGSSMKNDEGRRRRRSRPPSQRQQRKLDCITAPPAYFQRWIEAGDVGEIPFSTIPRPKIGGKRSDNNDSILTAFSFEDHSECRTFRPITASPSLPPSSAPLTPPPSSSPPSPPPPPPPPLPPPSPTVSSHPVCPRTPAKLDQDSLFNSSYHPYSNEPSEMSVTPGTSITSLNSITSELSSTSDSLDAETMVHIEYRQTSHRLSLSFSGFRTP